jgi:hypothetical protein
MQRLFENPLARVAAGLGVSSLENHTILDDADPSLKTTNLVLGGASGLGAPATGLRDLGEYAAKTWIPKQMMMFGLNAGDKYIRQQEPIARTNLQTSIVANTTERMKQEAAQHMSSTDMAQLGLAGAGLAGAGGLGYYLYKTLGAGKKKAPPRMTVDMPLRGNRGSVEISGDLDPVDMSKQLYSRLQRDQKRLIRLETKENTKHHTKVGSHGIQFAATVSPLQNIIKLLGGQPCA